MVSYMEDPEIYYVGTDNEKGAFMATEHLIKLGYERIGYVNGGEGNLLGLLRKKGYERALKKYKRNVNSKLIFNLSLTEDRFKSGYELGKNFLNLKLKPDALFFYTDLAALGFQQGVTELGLKVPGDVAIVGFDNIDLSKYGSIPLTTIEQNANKIGELAVESVIKRLEGKETAVRTILEPKIIVRSSCGASLKNEKPVSN